MRPFLEIILGIILVVCFLALGAILLVMRNDSVSDYLLQRASQNQLGYVALILGGVFSVLVLAGFKTGKLDLNHVTVTREASPVRFSIIIISYLVAAIVCFTVAPGLLSGAPGSVESVRANAQRGDVGAQLRLGRMYEAGEGVPANDAEAFRWYQLAAQQGEAVGQHNAGVMYAHGKGVPEDDAEAVRWYRLAAAQGYPPSQLNLGFMLAAGEGVQQDDAEAVRWWRLAAKQGVPDAQRNLGNAYATGKGVPENDIEAVQWLRLAAEQGHAGAQDNFGAMLSSGEGVQQDDTQAIQWFRRAAEQGNAAGQRNLGAMYWNGRGVPAVDHVEAVRWFRRAAAQGYEPAHIDLGRAYENGSGVRQSDENAYFWYGVAATSFKGSADGSAGPARDRIASKMTQEQRSAADRQVAACLASGFSDCQEPAIGR